MSDLAEQLLAPEAGEEDFLVDLLENRVPPGVDDAAYVKVRPPLPPAGTLYGARSYRK